MKRKSPAARFAPTTQAVPLALVLLAAMLAAGCQNINVDTEKLLSPTVSNGRADGRFVPGTSDAVTITDPNDGSTVKFSIDGGATQIYSVPITLTDDATIEAWTEKPGLVPSARTAASFRLAWRTLTTKLPAKRFTHAAVSTSDGIWISGGLADDASTRISGVLLFTTAKALVEKPDLPGAR
ncbi:MAG TPA: chitobiase/beta-hexosaminidase C-terminal domain-containing protein, partial [Spirochaetales bacterium]|nr:chitobiase/beta-hexosaminidase C-terminal domain-containing protein [Spirochaetales bacterium]